MKIIHPVVLNIDHLCNHIYFHPFREIFHAHTLYRVPKQFVLKMLLGCFANYYGWTNAFNATHDYSDISVLCFFLCRHMHS